MMRLISGDSEMTISEETGQIRQITRADMDYLKEEDQTIRGPFRLHVPLVDFEAHMLEGSLVPPTIHGDDGQVEVQYRGVQGKRGVMDIPATMTIRSRGDGSYALSLTLENRTDRPIPQVFFPYVESFRQLDGREDAITFGKSRFQPWVEWEELSDAGTISFMFHSGHLGRPELCRDYIDPGKSGMKWMDYNNESTGISLYNEDVSTTFQTMYASTKRYGHDTLDLSWFFYPYIQPGATWASPDFVLYPHAGDWHRGVLKFKEFTDTAFTPVASTEERDRSLGQGTLWLSWHYQDWQDVKYRFGDIPGFAAEFAEAGLTEMTVARATELDFCLPHKVREPLGTDEELRQAVEECRELGVNAIPFITCYHIRPDTIPADQDMNEWYATSVAGMYHGDANIWTYDPLMTPEMGVRQIGSRAGYTSCPGSRGWQEAFRSFTRDVVHGTWGYSGYMFDCSCVPFHLCFNSLHSHDVDKPNDEMLAIFKETRAYLVDEDGQRAVMSGEGLLDAYTEVMDYTWVWHRFLDEDYAPFHMAFPRSRECMKVNDRKTLINRVFTAGYWLDMFLEDGIGRLSEYPQLMEYLKSLARFKERFLDFFAERDTYLHDMHVTCHNCENAWIRVHRSKDQALVMFTTHDGEPARISAIVDVERILGPGDATGVLLSRELESLGEVCCVALTDVEVDVLPEDFVALHLEKTT